MVLFVVIIAPTEIYAVAYGIEALPQALNLLRRLIARTLLVVVDTVLVPYIGRRKIGHHYICTRKDSKLASAAVQRCKSRCCRQQSVRKAQAQQRYNKNCQIHRAGRKIFERRARCGNERPDAYHLRTQFVEEHHIVGKMLQRLHCQGKSHSTPARPWPGIPCLSPH